jgi:hypothetical protein
MQPGRRAAGAPAVGRVLPTPPHAHAAPLPPVLRGAAGTAGVGTSRKALNGPLELVQRGTLTHTHTHAC